MADTDQSGASQPQPVAAKEAVFDLLDQRDKVLPLELALAVFLEGQRGVDSYDAADEETQYTPPNVGAPMSYNLDRQVTLVSRPDGDFITPQYDPTNGRLQSISTAAGTTTFGYKTTTGQLQSIAAPGETLTYGYDGSLLTSVAWSGSVSGSLTRTYDTSFRVAIETVAGTTINYSYDNDDLLTQAGDLHIPRDPATGLVSSGATLGTLQEATTYDAYGALQTYTVNSCPTTPCTTLYSVDYGTRDALGRIVHKTETVQGQTHTYDYGTGVVKAQFIYAGDSGPAYMVKGGKTYRFVKDQLGTVREVVESVTGAVFEGIDYDEFGNVLADTSTVAVTPFGLASGLYDRDTGLVRFGARDYDAATGRWTAKDPSGLEGGINIYEYAANDPINNIDFDGEDWRDWELQPYADFFAGYADIMTGIPFTSMSVTGLIRN